MSTFQDRLERELDRAADRIIDGRRPARVRPLLVAAAAALLIAAVLAATLHGRDERPARRVPAPPARPGISLLTRPLTAADRAALERTPPPGIVGVRAGDWRLAARIGRTDVIVAPGPQHRVCVSTGVLTICRHPWSHGFDHDAIPLYQDHAHIVGLVYDGVDQVTVTRRSTGRSTLPVHDNVFVADADDTGAYPDVMWIHWRERGRPAGIRVDQGRHTLTPVDGTGGAVMDYTDRDWRLQLYGAARRAHASVWVSGPGVRTHELPGFHDRPLVFQTPERPDRYTRVEVRDGTTVLFKGFVPRGLTPMYP